MNDTITLPEVGTKVRAKYIPSVTGREDREWTNDYVFTVTKVEPNHDHYIDGVHTNGPAVWGDFTNPLHNTTYCYYVTQWEAVDETAATPEPVLTDEQREIADLKFRIERLNNELSLLRQDATRAIEIIGDRLISESQRRGWCEEFDNIIEAVNTELPGWLELPIRSRDYTVTWTEYVQVTIRRSMTVTASNYDDAIETAQNEDCGFDMEDLRNAYYAGNYETTETSDWEAEDD